MAGAFSIRHLTMVEKCGEMVASSKISIFLKKNEIYYRITMKYIHTDEIKAKLFLDRNRRS